MTGIPIHGSIVANVYWGLIMYQQRRHRMLLAMRTTLIACIAIALLFPAHTVGEMGPDNTAYVSAADIRMPNHEGEKPFIDTRTRISAKPSEDGIKIYRCDSMFPVYYLENNDGTITPVTVE